MSRKAGWIIVSLIIVLAIGTFANGFLYYEKSRELANVQSEVSTLQSSIRELSSSTSSVDAGVTRLTDAISTMDGKISALGGKLDSNTASILDQLTTLSDRTTTIGKDTAALKTQTHAVVDAINKVMPSVVHIHAQIRSAAPGQTLISMGSGVILRPDGYILTNKHVIAGAATVQVILQDRRAFQTTGMWLDSILDLAVVKIDGQDLPAACRCDPDSINIGDTIVALGFPLGLSPAEGGATASAGIVSNLSRSFQIDSTPYYDLIQVDAAINPGNSGGPLINTSGEVIGINSARVLEAENIGFAINIATAGHVFDDLVQYGKAHHPYLGVRLVDYEQMVPGGRSTTIGAQITAVDSGSPANAANLRAYDVILSFDGQEVATAADLIRTLWRHHSGDTAELVVQRGGTEINISLILAERPDNSNFI